MLENLFGCLNMFVLTFRQEDIFCYKTELGEVEIHCSCLTQSNTEVWQQCVQMALSQS